MLELWILYMALAFLEFYK